LKSIKLVVVFGKKLIRKIKKWKLKRKISTKPRFLWV